MLREAVIVGVDEYKASRYSNLRNARKDAARVMGFLTSALPPEQRFHAEFFADPTASEVSLYLEDILPKLSDDSVFVFYFAGHGLYHRSSGKQLLLCRDASGLLADGSDAPGALSLGFLRDFSQSGKGNMFFCYDVCRKTIESARGESDFGGATGFRDATSARPTAALGGSGLRWSLTSCATGKLAGDEGLFVDALLGEMQSALDVRHQIQLGDDLVNGVVRRLRASGSLQQPESSGNSFVLASNVGVAPPIPPRTTQTPAPMLQPKPAPQVDALKPRVASARKSSAQKILLTTSAVALVALGFWFGGRFGGALNDDRERVVAPTSPHISEEAPTPPTPSADVGESAPSESPAVATASPASQAQELFASAQKLADEKKYSEAFEKMKEVEKLDPQNRVYEAYSAQLDSLIKEASKTTSRTAGERKVLTIAGVEVAFRWQPAGRFTMGSPESEEKRNDNETQHEVILTQGFWLAETETTQALWKAVMGSNPSVFKGDDLLPVESVSWEECQDFIAKLNGLRVSGAGKFRLPSESEWEYACRAGSTTPFPWGSSLNGDKANCDGNYPYGTKTKGKYLAKTTRVGSYEANAWGLYDMIGNVREWCQDWYAAYPSGAQTDPQGASEGSIRVLRGGSWYSDPRNCRSAFRGCSAPAYRSSNNGFRVAMTGESALFESSSK